MAAVFSNSTVLNTHPVDNRAPPLCGVTITLLVLTVVSFSMRAYVRACMIKSFGVEDWLMTGATLIFVCYCACVLAGVHYGTGRHFADLSASDARLALKVLEPEVIFISGQNADYCGGTSSPFRAIAWP